MALQKVNHISYLSVVPIDLSEQDDPSNVDVCILPKQSQILDVSLEVVTPAPATSVATLSIDSKEFISSADIAQVISHRSGVITSVKDKNILKGNFSGNSGEVVVRVHYFLPSQIVAEYAD